tara:strand:+ start:450 stop:644 length:195 start_codon:yes stop_codon:yes gene_type:complete
MEKLLHDAQLSDYIFKELGDTYNFHLANKVSQADIDIALLDKAVELNFANLQPHEIVIHFYNRL